MPDATYIAICGLACSFAGFLWRVLVRSESSSPPTATSIVISELDSVFAPGSIHWRKQQQHMAMMRDEVDAGDRPFGYVDLDANKAVIRIPPAV